MNDEQEHEETLTEMIQKEIEKYLLETEIEPKTDHGIKRYTKKKYTKKKGKHRPQKNKNVKKKKR